MTVSVVITCYNYGKYLERCLESVLSQTYSDIEIIIVNDGSTDNTDEVISKFTKVKNLIYIKQCNAGQANAKNAGINEATGSYIAFLDADDLWSPDKLEKQMDKFANMNVGVVYSRAKYIDENNDIVNEEITGRYLQPRRGKVTNWLLYDNFVPFSSSIIRRECLDRFGSFDETLAMGIDWDLWLRLSTCFEFDYVHEQLLFYRIGHPGQMSKNIAERHRCSDKIMAKFLNSFPDTISKCDLVKIKAYTYCNRGEEIWDIDKKRSYSMYLKAIALYPFWMPAYKGMLKNMLSGRLN
jgi:glycosyltransferase involved in cell wall biosynthesis